MKFCENPSSGSRVVPCGRIYRRTDITKLIVTFRNFANAHIKQPAIISCWNRMRSVLLFNNIKSVSTLSVQYDSVLRYNLEAVLRYNFEAHSKYGIQIRHMKTNLKGQQCQIYFHSFIEIFAVPYTLATIMTWYTNVIAIYVQRRSKLHFPLYSFSMSYFKNSGLNLTFNYKVNNQILLVLLLLLIQSNINIKCQLVQ